MLKRRYFVLIWLTLLLPALAAAQQPRMTPELLWQLGRLDGGAMSPDGQRVAYSVRRYDLAKNSGASELHIVTLADGQVTVPLSNLRTISSIQWINRPSGAQLYFVAASASDSEAAPQVFVMESAGGTPRQITNIAAGVSNLKVSPNGNHLAFTIDVKMDPTVQELYPDLPLADARIIDSLMYRHWNAWHDYAYSHLHIAPLQADGSAGPELDLMRGLRVDSPLPPFGGAEQFDWSPDGQEIAYTMKIANNWAESTDSDIYLVRVDQPDVRHCITHGMNGYDTDPLYSPDGSWLAFHSMQRPGFEADRNRIMLYDRAARSIRELTINVDQSAHGSRWSPDGKSIYFASESKGTRQLYRMPLDGSVSAITSGQFDWRLCDLAADGQKLLVAQQTMLRPEELIVLDLATSTQTIVSHINDSHYANLALPQVREKWVRSSDGEMVQSWIIYPPDFDPNTTWPMLTYCQGGPQSQIGQGFSYRWNFHLMAANGYVVLAVNRRGLPGFGQARNDQISGDWGGQAMQDILAATDEMLSESYIDPKRVGAVGASFGGYTVYWLMGHHQDRFRCMIAHCGVFNLESMYGSTEELFFVNHDMGGPYWKSDALRAKYEAFSPHRFVANWKTPLLVIHGEKDFRVPVTQGMEAFTAAQVEGVPSRFLYFPNEGHWVLSPQNSVLWQRVFYEWLDRYCGKGLQN